MPLRDVLSLPRELRDMIYDFALAPTARDIHLKNSKGVPYTYHTYDRSLKALSLNRATRLEVKQALTRTETFILVTMNGCDVLSMFAELTGRAVTYDLKGAALFRGQNYHSLRVDIKMPLDDNGKRVNEESGTREAYSMVLRVQELPTFCRALQWILYMQTDRVGALVRAMDGQGLAVPSSGPVDTKIKFKLIPRADKPITKSLEKTLLEPFMNCIGLHQTVTVFGASSELASTLAPRMCPSSPNLEAVAWTMLPAEAAVYEKVIGLYKQGAYHELIGMFGVVSYCWTAGILNFVPDNMFGLWAQPVLRTNAILLDIAAMAMTSHFHLHGARGTLDW
ncbi:hypothetical protein CLAFUW4_10608 [Fulvia fulva]|uniref:Uncharacterized protein n=1 Tax=Passalora fulva TaxID=5499 RepID=A0A9Q8P7N4_PASFU|nr:uncharacterized protein CLAFUR5_05221 [Fulvia fulva]KAK4615567.1 hypothetical protein CLAFUR4_10613 [Fulvia fulva]KAK4616785.1 hypothetical protein CLAFUR0_10631 [Fulvia fulva]UJO16335.1 hypothetical protein CLAFUR5_05221 [Fulvia fulva]WPV19441.1 hypothetical protein CLAFUW4_10608 [Fulvia fulva]WPV34540.1 hypothetical protein CLAFUW7_10610 [Fulvia fulva]